MFAGQRDRLKAKLPHVFRNGREDEEVFRVIFAALAVIIILNFVLWPHIKKQTHTQRPKTSTGVSSEQQDTSSGDIREGIAVVYGPEAGEEDDSQYTSEEGKRVAQPTVPAGSSRTVVPASDHMAHAALTLTHAPAHLRSVSPQQLYLASSPASKKRRKRSRLVHVDTGSEQSEEEQQHHQRPIAGISTAFQTCNATGAHGSATASNIACSRARVNRNSFNSAGLDTSSMRPGFKRKVGSIEAPAPIPERNSSYYRPFAVPKPNPILVGLDAKDKPPSILRKDNQRFAPSPSSPAPLNHEHDHWPTPLSLKAPLSSTQPEAARGRAIRLTEPDWDPYAPWHERARQRMEARQLSGQSRLAAPVTVANDADDEPPSSWLAYTAIHPPGERAADALSSSLPASACLWQEACPDDNQEFWFERFTSSTAAAGKNWDWRKRRAR